MSNKTNAETKEELIYEAPVRSEEVGGGTKYASSIDGWLDQLQMFVREQDADISEISQLRPVMITVVESEETDHQRTLIRDQHLPTLSQQGVMATEAQFGGTLQEGSSYLLLLPSADCSAFESDSRYEVEYRPSEMVEEIVGNHRNFLPTEIFTDSANPWYRSRWFQHFNQVEGTDSPLVWEGRDEWSSEKDVNQYEKWLRQAIGEDEVESTPTKEVTRRDELLSLDYADLEAEAEAHGIDAQFRPVSEVVDEILEAEE